MIIMPSFSKSQHCYGHVLTGTDCPEKQISKQTKKKSIIFYNSNKKFMFPTKTKINIFNSLIIWLAAKLVSSRVDQPGDIQDKSVAEQSGNKPCICPCLTPKVNGRNCW